MRVRRSRLSHWPVIKISIFIEGKRFTSFIETLLTFSVKSFDRLLLDLNTVTRDPLWNDVTFDTRTQFMNVAGECS